MSVETPVPGDSFIPADTVLPWKDEPMVYQDRFGAERELANTFVFEPNLTPSPLLNDTCNEVREIVGQEALEHLRGKTVVVPFVFAGWGHMFQAYVLAEGFRALGARVILTDIKELATPEEAIPLDLRQAFLKRFHSGDQFTKPWGLNRRFAMHTWLGDMMRVAILELAVSHVRSTGWEKNGKPTFLDRVATLLGEVMEKNKSFRRAFVRTGVIIDQALFDKKFTPSLVHFCDTVGADAVIATHSTPARALTGTRYEERTILAVPDPGYAISPEFLMPMIALGDSLTTGTPSGRMTELLTEFFGVPQNKIMDDIGTLTLSHQRIATEKWSRNERIILLSTSGNGTHLNYIAKAIEQMSERLKNGNTPYRLIVFLGDLPQEKVKIVLDTIKQHGLTDNPHLKVIRTKNAYDTAAMKWWCKLNSHIEIAKPGEQPLDNPLMGTVTLALPAGFANESPNLAISWSQWQASLPCAWPPDVYQYWNRSPEFRRKKFPGYEKPFESFPDYLDYIFGNNPRLDNIALRLATQGMYRAPADALLHYLVKGVGLITRKKQEIQADSLLSYLSQSTRPAPEIFDPLTARKMMECVLARHRREKITGLLTRDWRYASDLGDLLTRLQLEAAGLSSLDAFINVATPKTAVITIHGGAGTRWADSFDTSDGASVARTLGLDDEARQKARGLAPIPNLLPQYGSKPLPIIGYNLHQIIKIIQAGASHSLVHSNRECDGAGFKQLLSRMGLSTTTLHAQHVREGESKMLGHGDALIQLKEHLKNLLAEGREYTLLHFGGEPNSAYTMVTALLTLYTSSLNGENPAVVVPTARMEKPLYPVLLSSKEYIARLGHAKLLGEHSADLHIGTAVSDSETGKEEKLTVGGSNVGVWVLRTEALLSALEEIESRYRQEGSYLFLPGHDKSGVNECAIDDIVVFLARKGERVIQLATADPNEITGTVKQLRDIPGFLETMQQVLNRDELRFALNS